MRPLLLIDADPVGGLGAAIGHCAEKTLGGVREEVIAAARDSGEQQRERLAAQLDYMVLEALHEQDNFSLLSIGRNANKGCFCPVNTLLRSAIDILVEPFAAVLIDAEAGVEQINREVTRRVSQVVAVSDGSARSVAALQLIFDLVAPTPLAVVANRGEQAVLDHLPPGVQALGTLPEDAELRALDRAGRPLWELGPGEPARAAMPAMACALGFDLPPP